MFKFKDEVLPVKSELKYWYTWKILKALQCVWGIAHYRKCVATSSEKLVARRRWWSVIM